MNDIVRAIDSNLATFIVANPLPLSPTVVPTDLIVAHMSEHCFDGHLVKFKNYFSVPWYQDEVDLAGLQFLAPGFKCLVDALIQELGTLPPETVLYSAIPNGIIGEGKVYEYCGLKLVRIIYQNVCSLVMIYGVAIEPCSSAEAVTRIQGPETGGEGSSHSTPLEGSDGAACSSG